LFVKILRWDASFKGGVLILTSAENFQVRYGNLFRRLALFFGGQVSLQALTAITGFLIIRFLSKTEFADFSVAFAFQATMGVLIDIGFSNSIVALVRDRANDDSVIFGYILAALKARKWLLISISLIGALVYSYLSVRNHRPVFESVLYYLGIVFYVFNQKYVILLSYFRIKKMMKEMYSAQIGVLILRLVFIVVLKWSGVISGLAVLWLGSLQCALLGHLIGNQIQIPSNLNRDEMQTNVREMFVFLRPQMPGAVFYAFQGQIVIGIIAYFGSSTSIADTAVMGRFSQIFMLIGAFISTIIEPAFAKIENERVFKLYLLILLGYIIVSVFLVGVFLKFGTFALLILGGQYRGLEFPLILTIVGGCISQATVLFWVLNTSRHWNYSWVYIAIIVSTVLLQILLCRRLNLSTVVGVLWFQLWSSLVAMVVHFAVGIYEIGKLQMLSRNRLAK
jgi:O-antigen/teichoic acid export membrane protein